MGYKLLGFAVWRGARWYLGRRIARSRTKVAAVGVAAAVVGGVVVAGQARSRGGD